MRGFGGFAAGVPCSKVTLRADRTIIKRASSGNGEVSYTQVGMTGTGKIESQREKVVTPTTALPGGLGSLNHLCVGIIDRGGGV